MLKSLIRWFRSLQAQLFLWAILPATFVVIGLAFAGVYTHEQAMRDFVADRNAVVVRLISIQIEDGIAHGLIAPDGEGLSAWLPLQDLATSGTLYVIDSRGQVLAHTDPAQVHTNVSREPGIDVVVQSSGGTLVLPDARDRLLMISFLAVRGTDWAVILREPVDDLLGPILRFSSLGPQVAIVAAGLSMLMLTFGWRTIVRPLRQLARAAGHVSWGDHTAMDQDITGVLEIQDLHQALHAMVQRIEGYETGIRDYLDVVTEEMENERAHLARELHDGPVQSLIALGQRAEMVRQIVERGDYERAIVVLADLRASEIAVVDELRRLIGALRPIYLEDLGFLPALDMLVRTMAQYSTVDIQLDHGAEIPRLPANAELAVYRIAQEALNNAVQHAQAQYIKVSVYRCSGGIVLTVSDDGVGFTPMGRLDQYTRQGHFGLVGIQERARQLDGSLHIVSAPGEGTVLTVRIPNPQ